MLSEWNGIFLYNLISNWSNYRGFNRCKFLSVMKIYYNINFWEITKMFLFVIENLDCKIFIYLSYERYKTM